MSFDDRFKPETYADDDPVEIGTSPPGVTATVPERIFARAQHIATGYQLHLLPVIPTAGTTTLVRDQCSTLLEELRFMEALVGDELLARHLAGIAAVVESCLRSPAATRLIIEGP